MGFSPKLFSRFAKGLVHPEGQLAQFHDPVVQANPHLPPELAWAEHYGSRSVAFARKFKPGEEAAATGVFAAGRPPENAPIVSRVGAVVNAGRSADNKLTPPKSNQEIDDEKAIALIQLLVEVVVASAQTRMQGQADKVKASPERLREVKILLRTAKLRDNRMAIKKLKAELAKLRGTSSNDRRRQAEALERDIRKIQTRLTSLKRQLRVPGAPGNQQIIRAIFDYVAKVPALRKKYTAFVNPLAEYLEMGTGDYIRVRGSTVRKGKKTEVVDLDRTPLEQFANKEWQEICRLCGFEPRFYQSSWLEALLVRAEHGFDRGLLGAPTQVGKTFACFPLALALAQGYYPGKTILIIAPQRVVVDSIRDDIARVMGDVKVGIINADHKDFGKGYDVVVASTSTIGRKEHLKTLDPNLYGVVATDEAMFLQTTTGKGILKRLGFLDDKSLVQKNKGKFLFGFSADARMFGLTGIFGDNARLDEFDLPWYIQNKFLHEPVGIRIKYSDSISKDQWEVIHESGDEISVPKVSLKYVGQVYETVRRRFGDGNVVVFCPNIAHAEAIVAYFNTVQKDGYAYAYHSRKSADANHAAQKGFQDGTGPKVIVGVEALSVGFRAKGAVGVVMVHETSSSRRYGQRLGRILGIHDGEDPRRVSVVEMVGKSRHIKRPVSLPQLMGIEGYPGDEVEYRPLLILAGKKERKPVPQFKVVPAADGMGVDFVETAQHVEIINFPKRFPSRVRAVLDERYQGDIAAMSRDTEITEDELESFIACSLPKNYAMVWRFANIVQPDNPASVVDAWVADYLDLMEVTFALPVWQEAPAVTEMIRFIRRQSLTVEYGQQDGSHFASGLTLTADEARQLGFIIRGELVDDDGGIRVIGWKELARTVMVRSQEIDAELVNDILLRAEKEIFALADLRRDKQGHDKRSPELEIEPRASSSIDDIGDFNPNLAKRIDEIGLSTRVINILINEHNLEYVYQIAAMYKVGLLRLENVGDKAYSEIAIKLEELGLTLRMNLTGFPLYEAELARRQNAHVGLDNIHIDKIIHDTGLSSIILDQELFSGMFYLGEIARMSEGVIRDYRYYGDSLLPTVKRVLGRHSLELGMALAGWIMPDRRPGEAGRKALHDKLDMPIRTFVRYNSSLECLQRAGIRCVGQIVELDKSQLRKLGIDQYSVEEIEHELVCWKLSFGMDTMGWESKKVSIAQYKNLAKSIGGLKISVRSFNCLENLGIKYIHELVQKTEAELLKGKSMGRKSLREVRDMLDGLGLSLNMDISKYDTSSLPEDILIELNRKVISLGFSGSTLKVLHDAGIYYLGDLVTKDESDIKPSKFAAHRFSKEVKVVFNKMGYSFGMNIKGWQRSEASILTPKQKRNMEKRIDGLELSERSKNALQNAGILFVYQLVSKSEGKILKLENIGPKSLNEIREVLDELGLSLFMDAN
jgi:DNA-directed RNA polymerase alpha subunit/superfamily II DNA or RNA helicase